MNLLKKGIFIVFTILITANIYGQEATVGIKKLAERIIPSWKEHFVYEMISSEQDIFELESVSGKIVIRGNNNNSLAVGLNYYLKYYCHTDISWYDEAITLPSEVPPAIQNKIRKTTGLEYRFFLNYCTFGYTMPWWQWRDWERFIDWMALNGVTSPLAITGQEAIWYEVWKELGLTDKQIREYFTGPAYLPWHRMSNIDKWDGPLPLSWLKNQLELQKKIVQRERELGMKPILPAFAGHVPLAIKDKYPDAKITTLGRWGGFDKDYSSYFLDPFDPLFKKIQKLFLKEQHKLYGTNHIYGIDPFNEVRPPSWEPEYLASVSKTIFESLVESDPEAIWLQMGWLFYHNKKDWTKERIDAFLNAVPKNRMILLDYYAEQTEVWKLTDKFFGQPYIWCYLGNFGGNTMLAGNIDEVSLRLNQVCRDGGPNLKGLGSTLEGLDVNPLMYEFVFEKAWENTTTDMAEWVKDYSTRRYGSENENVQKAWDILHRKIYTTPSRLADGSLMQLKPSFEGKTRWVNPVINYDNRDLLKAWEFLLSAPDSRQPAHQYDVVNVGRQTLENHFKTLFDHFCISYQNKDLMQLKKDSALMLDLISDVDKLIATQKSFLLGQWINSAMALGKNQKEKEYYAVDARKLITTWNAPGQHLNDYAHRSYAGLLKDFYGKRWSMFIHDVLESVKNNKAFVQKDFDAKVSKWEWKWIYQNKAFSSKPEGSSMNISRELFNKYKADIIK